MKKTVPVLFAFFILQLAKAQPSKSYLMAYHTCSSSSSCSNPANHTVQLAESNDGTSWSSVPGYTTISNSGSVPDVITRGDKLYLYSTQGVRRYTRSTNTWETMATNISVKDAAGTTVNYVDPSLIVDGSGNLVLFFLESAGPGTGDPATCTVYPCTKNFKSATEVSGSDGTQFVVNTGVRLAINLTANSASDPDIYYDGTRYILYISSGTNTLAYSSTTLHGTYTAISTLTNGLLTNEGGIGSGYFDANTNNYWTYIHTNAGEIKQKIHPNLNSSISGFTTVINFATAGLSAGSLAQSPGICKNELSTSGGGTVVTTKNVSVDYTSNAGTFKKVSSVNGGPGAAPLGYKDLKLQMIRTHDYYGPFDYYTYSKNFYNATTQTFSTTFNASDTGSYDFKQSDSAMSPIVSNGFTPFFRLGASYPSSSLVPTIPPADITTDPNFTKFASIATQTVRHYTAGFKNGFTYSIPYWEIWNEPNLSLFWSGANATAANYYKMYKSVADSVRKVNPALKVGGPGLAYIGILLHQTPYYDSLVSFCQKNNTAMDFYSWHLYDCANPYAIKVYGDTVKQILNKYNFTSAESIVTEINPKLNNDTIYDGKPKSAAYAASVLMATQESQVDKLFWYRGLQLGKLVGNDSLGQPNVSWAGYAFKAFDNLLNNCTKKLSSTGNEVIATNLQTDTTNVMILSGKSVTGDTVEVFISNEKSAYTTINLALNNLPWVSTNTIAITHYRIQSGAAYTTTSSSVSGAAAINYAITNAGSPSLHYIRFTKNVATAVAPVTNTNKSWQVFPNPVNGNVLYLRKTTAGYGSSSNTTAQIINNYGMVVKQFSILAGRADVNVQDLVNGNYAVRIIEKNAVSVVRFVKL